jgi:hypothetical protein
MKRPRGGITWTRRPHVQKMLRTLADPGPVTGKQTQQARGEVSQAIAFLAWLHGRGRALADCRQADVDAW